MALNRIVQVVYLLLLALDVTLTQDQPRCTETDEGHARWVSLTTQIPVRNYVHTSNLTINHNFIDTCPSMSSGYTIDELSLCPWTYRIHTDYQRYPNDMPYAECNCGSCGNPRPGRQMRCTPLQQNFHVIKRICEGGLYRYVFTQERLPIACVCTHRPVVLITPVPH